MRYGLVVCWCLAAPAAMRCQTPASPAQGIARERIELATQKLEQIKKLVEIGAEARIRLEQAEQDLADAQDLAMLEQTRYAEFDKLSDQLVDDVIAAAERRVERARERMESARKLSAGGFAPASDLTALEQELSERQIDLDWARSRARFKSEVAALAELSEAVAYPATAAHPEDRDGFAKVMEHYEGAGTFDESRDLKPLSLAFETEFERPLPISADGGTELHRTLGFDHRGRVDVALNPGDPEGVWLRRYLQSRKIPYYAFTRAVPGKATAAHIHIGPGSARLPNAD